MSDAARQAKGARDRRVVTTLPTDVRTAYEQRAATLERQADTLNRKVFSDLRARKRKLKPAERKELRDTAAKWLDQAMQIRLRVGRTVPAGLGEQPKPNSLAAFRQGRAHGAA